MLAPLFAMFSGLSKSRKAAKIGVRPKSPTSCVPQRASVFLGNFSQHQISIFSTVSIGGQRSVRFLFSGVIRGKILEKKKRLQVLFPGFIRFFRIMNIYDVYLYRDGCTEIIKVEAATSLEAKAIAESRLGIAESGFDQDRHVFAVSERTDRDSWRK